MKKRKKRRKSIREMSHRERVHLLLENLERKISVIYAHRVLRQMKREWDEIVAIRDEAIRRHGEQ